MLYLARSVAVAGAALVAAGAAPAAIVPVGGTWCGAGLLRDFTLDIAQQYQHFEARLIRRGKVREITGRLDGATLRTDPQRNETMELLAQGNELRIIGATGVLALAKGQFFTRAAGGSCSR
jgi:hypothetical protein